MLSQATPAVVNITVEKEIPSATNPLEPVDDQQPPTKVLGVGSGIIIDAKNGYIVTNAHVVSDQHLMIVTLKDGRRYHGKLIGKDNGFDIAVIQIHAKYLTAISMGDSNDLKVGDFVVAIGSPFGLTQTVTSGVVSALNRSEPRIDSFQNFIQTDAPINPGNSGGALLNLNGQLVGVNTAIVSPSSGNIGIGFAIPSNMVKSVADQLIQYGNVARGMLGVMAQNITPELADAMSLKHNRGAIVTEVVPDSPAAASGIEVQDIIQSVDGTPIESSEQLHNMLGLVRPGTQIHLTVLRDHKAVNLAATIQDPKKLMMQRALPFLDGMQLQKFSDLEPDGTLLKGVLVTNLTDSSDGALAGLIPGDIIISANNEPTPTIQQLIHVAESKPKQLLLKVSRDNKQLFLVIEQDQ